MPIFNTKKKAVTIEKNESFLSDFLERHGWDMASFARKAVIPYKTFYDVVKKGARPRKRLAKRICNASNGELTLADFGYEPS